MQFKPRLLLVAIIYLSISAQAQEKFWAARAGIDLSGLMVESSGNTFHLSPGYHAAFVYREDYQNTGFDLGLEWAQQQAENDSLRKSFSNIALDVRLKAYTTKKKQLGFLLGYVIRTNIVQPTASNRILMGAHLGFILKLSTRAKLEGSFFFPVQKTGDVKWLETQTVDSVTEKIEAKEPYYLYTFGFSVCYDLFERY